MSVRLAFIDQILHTHDSKATTTPHNKINIINNNNNNKYDLITTARKYKKKHPPNKGSVIIVMSLVEDVIRILIQPKTISLDKYFH